MSDVDQTLRKSHHSGMLQLALRHRKSRSHRSAVDAKRTEEECLKLQGESPPYILNRKCDGPQDGQDAMRRIKNFLSLLRVETRLLSIILAWLF